MISAPQSERRRRQDDAHMARRGSVDMAGHARRRINFEAFRRGVTVADMLREILEGAIPGYRAAS
jgi:hypothetical protein